jgi:hypothetical protein
MTQIKENNKYFLTLDNLNLQLRICQVSGEASKDRTDQLANIFIYFESESFFAFL